MLGNIALIGVVAGVSKAGALPNAWGDYLGAIVFVQFFLIVQNLVPFWTTVNGVRIGSDGLQFLQIVLGPWRSPTQAGLLYAAIRKRMAAQPGAASARLRSPIYQCASDQWNDAEARRDFQDA